MVARRRTHLLIAGLLAILAALPAAAAPPTIETFFIDETIVSEFVSEACGFEIERHLEGHVKVITYANERNPVDVRFSDHLHGSFTNTATGESVTFVIAQNVTETIHHDGSSTVVIAGLRGRLTVPGQGLVTADVGRLVLTFPSDGSEPTVVFEAGRHEDPVSALCNILAE